MNDRIEKARMQYIYDDGEEYPQEAIEISEREEIMQDAKENFRKAINDNQPPIREGLIKLREKYKSMFNDYEEIYWDGSAEDLSDVLEGFIKDLDLLLSKDNDGE